MNQDKNDILNEDTELDLDNDVIPTDESGEETLQQKIKKLRDELSEANSQKQEYLDGWQRLKADFVNYKNQQQKTQADFAKFANEKLILEIIPALDSFELAISGTSSDVPIQWKNGLESVYNQFRKALADNNVKDINPLNEEFNPAEQSAVQSVPAEKKELDHRVVEVIQKGYKIEDRVLRPALVKVAVYSENA